MDPFRGKQMLSEGTVEFGLQVAVPDSTVTVAVAVAVPPVPVAVMV